jgi:hypothetical protein
VGWNANFDFVAHRKSATTAFLVQPNGRFRSNKQIVRFSQGCKGPSGDSDSLGELSGERELLVLREGTGGSARAEANVFRAGAPW